MKSNSVTSSGHPCGCAQPCDLTESMRSEPLTVKLNNGVTVLAKLYKGEPSALHFANRTQAQRRASEAGNGWQVRQFGRPFYVMHLQPELVTITPQAGAVRPLPSQIPDEQPSEQACEPCPNCGRNWFSDQLRDIRDPGQRIAPGEPMPAGECPECGALCHLSDAGETALARIARRVTGGGRTRATAQHQPKPKGQNVLC